MMKGIKRIGLPRAFWYFYFGPAIAVFFKTLGYEVVVTPPSTEEIIKAGSLGTTSDHCVSVKVYLGHVANLVGKVDAIFVPNILRTGLKWCPKLSGLERPVTIFSNIAGLPPLLSIAVDDHDTSAIWTSLYALGLKMGHSENELSCAAAKSKAMQQLFDRLMLQGRTVDEVLLSIESGNVNKCPAPLNNLLPPDALTMGVVGHRYTVGDPGVCGNMLQILRDNGCRVVTQDMVSKEDAEEEMRKGPFPGNYWYPERHIVGAAYRLMRHHLVDHLFLVNAALCGTTSVIRPFIESVAKERNISYSYIAIDEATEGIDTRFITPLEIAAHNAELTKRDNLPPMSSSQSVLSIPPAVHSSNGSLCITTPRWSHLAPVLTGVIRRTGVKTILPPPMDETTRKLAEDIAPEDICFPDKLTGASQLQAVEMGANAIVGIGQRQGVSGCCRLDAYSAVQQEMLRIRGYKDVEWLLLHAPTNGWGEFMRVLRRMTNDAPAHRIIRELSFGVKQLSACSEIDKLTCWLRPREVEVGNADALRGRYLDRIYEAIAFGEIRRVMAEAHDEYQSVRILHNSPAAVVLTGEIYMATEPFANDEVERVLGELGLEVWNMRSITDWFKLHVLGPFYPSLRHEHDKKIALVQDICLKVGGHGRETLAELMLARSMGASGVVQLAPSFCMPETTVLDRLQKAAREQNDLPLLVERFDCVPESSRQTCRETFAFQLTGRVGR